MGLEYAVALSGLLQLTAAIVAIALIPLTDKRLAWGLIASALFLMAARRGLSLYYLAGGDTTAIMDPLQEYIGLALSVLMLLGVIMVRPIFLETKLAMEAVSESEDKFRALFEQSVIAKSMTLPNGEIRANRALADLLGYTVEELSRGKTWQQLTYPDDVAETSRIIAAMLAGEIPSARFEKRYVRKDGEIIWAEVSTSPYQRADGETENFMTTILDITSRKQSEEQLLKQATTDELTDIPNRRRFFELANRELKRSVRHHEPVAIAFIDVDLLKEVNDTSGHAAGDRALIHLAETVLRCIREIDVVARLGGDEFALLLPETTSDQAHATVERIRTALAVPPSDPGAESFEMTISAGVAGMSSETETLDVLLSRADRALYAAKAAGRDRTVVDATPR